MIQSQGHHYPLRCALPCPLWILRTPALLASFPPSSPCLCPFCSSSCPGGSSISILLPHLGQHVPRSKSCDSFPSSLQGVGQIDIYGGVKHTHWPSLILQSLLFLNAWKYLRTHIIPLVVKPHHCFVEKAVFAGDPVSLISISFLTTLHIPFSLQIISFCLQVYFQNNSGKGVWLAHTFWPVVVPKIFWRDLRGRLASSWP